MDLYSTKANLAFKCPQREQKAKEMNSKKAEMAKKAKANAKQTEQTLLFGEAGHILSSPARSLLNTPREKVRAKCYA